VAEALEESGDMQIRKMTDGRAFRMGKGDTRNVFGPHNGAKRLTFNYAKFEPGVAFTQHIHDHSEDLILVLEGGGVIRLDDREFPIETGDVILVSEGESHGTVAGADGLTVVSVQAPPDPKLYDGSKDKAAGEGRAARC
jgi:quercetin dioxygenase-like cupin family protein